jgi:hypothetical protein
VNLRIHHFFAQVDIGFLAQVIGLASGQHHGERRGALAQTPQFFLDAHPFGLGVFQVDLEGRDVEESGQIFQNLGMIHVCAQFRRQNPVRGENQQTIRLAIGQKREGVSPRLSFAPILGFLGFFHLLAIGHARFRSGGVRRR